MDAGGADRQMGVAGEAAAMAAEESQQEKHEESQDED
jgi:hypothetical protein